MKQAKGFTIVELLIVIVVIGILAAITIVAFNGVQDRARSSATQSLATQISRKIALWQVDNPGQTPSVEAFNTITSGVSANATYEYTPGSNGAYCATVTSNSVSYAITESGAPSLGGCSGHGQNGQAAITNLVANPSLESNADFYAISSGNGGGSASGSRVTTGGLHGNSFYRATWSTAPTASGGAYIQNAGVGTSNVSPGKNYYLRASARASWTTTIRLVVVWQTASGQTISNAGLAGPIVTTTPNQWSTIDAVGPAPDGAVRVRLLIENIGTTSYPPVNGTLDADGLMIAEGEGPYTYRDGTSTSWLWNGTPHASTSYGPR